LSSAKRFFGVGELEKRGVWASGGFEVEWIVDVNDTTTFGSGELPEADTTDDTIFNAVVVHRTL
tara:strand:- start:393 stop:584 length:192 start_codon:yes stop_codon:yes gene_type:complete